MKTIDKYIIRQFLGTFFFMLAVIMSIAVVFDVSERLEDFVQSKAPLKEVIFDYYINFVFYYGNTFSSLLIFLSVLLFTGRLAQRSEIIAMFAGGVSFRRLLYPYFIAATVLVGISMYFTHYQLPIANTARLEFENRYLRKQFKIDDKNLNRQIADNTIAYFNSFSTSNNVGYQFSLEKWSDDGELLSKMTGSRARYDSSDGSWRISNYFIRKYTPDGERISQGAEMDTTLSMKPSDFGVRLNIASTMGHAELNDYIEAEKIKGSGQTVFFEIEKHQRTSYPFAAYVLTIIAVSMSGRKSRGGIGVHMAAGVLIAVIYIFAMKVTTVAATNAGLNPLLAVWLPNILFAGVAVYLYNRAQK